MSPTAESCSEATRVLDHGVARWLVSLQYFHSDQKVAVTRLHEKTFYASLWEGVGCHLHEIDTRPSDAINLVLRVQRPSL